MSNDRKQIAKMCIYIEEIFANDLISCLYGIDGDLANIVVEYPLYPNALLFSFFIPRRPMKYFYSSLVRALEDDTKHIIQKGAKLYGYSKKD